MRIYRYWARVSGQIAVGPHTDTIRCYGGSNRSMEEAREAARSRIQRVEAKINGRPLPEEDYEVEIREQIVSVLDDRNIVTRNRYGAEVLNCQNLMFIDIDRPPMRFWEVLFGVRFNKAQRKERIVNLVKKRVRKSDCRGLGFRVYETHDGIRVIVTGREFEPKSPQTVRFLRSFNADWLYTILCCKQGCFRARLTPKPYRMKCPTRKVIYPRDDPEQEGAFQDWLAQYEQARKDFQTCKYLCSLGLDQPSGAAKKVIDHHDRVTGVKKSLRLA